MTKHMPELPQDHVWAGDAESRPPAQSPLLAGRRDASYWLLVDQLMHLGWYRLGRRAGTGHEWGFRYGHTVPDAPLDPDLTSAQERWITAVHEQTAMRRLLRELR